MRLPKFNYFEPRRLDEAAALLAETPGAQVLAGGTDLLVNMKHRVETPETLVNLKKIPGLDAIASDSGDLKIGPLTTLKHLYRHPLIAAKASVLARAAAAVGSYHHQVMGTVGGNLCQQNRCKFFNQSSWWRSARPPCLKVGGEVCHVVPKTRVCYASYCGDLAPALLVLEARILLTGSRGSREVPISQFFSGDGRVPLTREPGELVTEITIPAASTGGFSTYVKFANRESIDFPIVGMALQGRPETGDYRLAFTAVDRRPVRGLKAEAFLKGRPLTPEIAEEAARLASGEASPVKNSLYTPSFKRNLMGRLLQVELTKRIPGKEMNR